MINISIYGLRVVKESTGRYDIEKNISDPQTVALTLESVLDLSNLAEEFFILITLDTKNKITGLFTVSHGSLNHSIVHPREVFKRALLQNSASIILAHNHPSGDLTPSEEDIRVTKRLVEAGDLIGIKIMDHIIIGGNKYLSFKGKGLIE